MEVSFLNLHCPLLLVKKRCALCESEEVILSLETFEYFTLSQIKLASS